MPPTLDAGNELSLRHLPDFSNASFSFQIPTAISKGDLLLGDNDMDFLKNVDDNMASPGHGSSGSHTALTLADLTPKARVEHPSFTEDSAPHIVDQQLEPKSNKIPQGIRKFVQNRSLTTKVDSRSSQKATRASTREASPAIARLRELRAEVEMLNEDSQGEAVDTISQHVVSEAPVLQRGSKLPKSTARRKQAIISGGITKSRSKNIQFKPNLARSLISAPQRHPSPQPPGLTHAFPEAAGLDEQNPDASLCSTVSGGVAERLILYSQKFIHSFGLSTPDNVSGPKIDPEPTCNIAAVPEPVVIDSNKRDTNDAPLTLSQISPRKPVSPGPSWSVPAAPSSPTRPSSKRPVSATSPHRPSKKGKTAVAASSKHASKDAIRRIPSSGINSSSGVPSRSSSSSRRGHATVTRKADEIRKKPAAAAPHQDASKVLDQVSLDRSNASRSASSSSSSLRHPSAEFSLPPKHSVSRPAEESCSGVASSSNTKVLQRHDTRVDLPPANATKPVEFKFQLDTRMEARKAEYVKERSQLMQKSRGQLMPIPDFKALHAQQEAEIAHRKENIQPIHPLVLELHTSERAKEREKFDQMIKEKEREVERVMEERRREREENEEREVRELRKKAVPRAHEVPEWYKEAPKKSKTVGDCEEVELLRMAVEKKNGILKPSIDEGL